VDEKRDYVHPPPLHGTPLYKPSQHCWCIVTVEWPDGKVTFPVWRSNAGAKSIRRAVKEHYPECKVQLGAVVWVTD
jgi:hypothetical protein